MNLTVVLATGVFLIAFNGLAAPLANAKRVGGLGWLKRLAVAAWLMLAAAHLLHLDGRMTVARSLLDFYKALLERAVGA